MVTAMAAYSKQFYLAILLASLAVILVAAAFIYSQLNKQAEIELSRQKAIADCIEDKIASGEIEPRGFVELSNWSASLEKSRAQDECEDYFTKK